MNNDFMDRIANPEHPELQRLAEQARSGVYEALTEWGWTDPDPETVRNLSFTYYHDWERDDPDCVFLVQDPGPVYDRHRQEFGTIRDIGGDPDPLDLVSLHRRFAASWLVQRNSDFARKFLDTCAEYGYVSPGSDWEGYVTGGGFFDDVYLTDVIKYRTDAHAARHHRPAYRGYVEEELRYVDPELLFVFGGDAWEVVRSAMDPSPVVDVDVDASKVTDAHGHPFRVTSPVETVVVPLVHFSGRIYHSLLRDSYFEYLDDGLQTVTNATQ